MTANRISEERTAGMSYYNLQKCIDTIRPKFYKGLLEWSVASRVTETPANAAAHGKVIQFMKERLKELILEHAFRYSDTPSFKLVHGGTSRFYFNCKRVTLDPEGQYLIGNLVFDEIRDLGIQAIGGLTLGADPIANAAAYTSWLEHQPIQAFVVRKKPKDHGTASLIEGKVTAGDRVAVVDDVVTTGGSTLQAISACREAGLSVVKVIVLVDRQEMNGRGAILQEVPHLAALVTRDEIMEIYRRENQMGR